jgi:hypothetical protein
MVEMGGDGRLTATVPGDYTDSPYPLAYFFTMRHAGGDACRAGTGRDAGEPALATWCVRRRAGREARAVADADRV